MATRCKRGHDLSVVGVYTSTGHTPVCRRCFRDAQAARAAKRRAALGLPPPTPRPRGTAEACSNGHPRAGNTYVAPGTGKRHCRLCQQAASRRAQDKKRATGTPGPGRGRAQAKRAPATPAQGRVRPPGERRPAAGSTLPSTCPQGHALTVESTYRMNGPKRHCRACRDERMTPISAGALSLDARQRRELDDFLDGLEAQRGQRRLESEYSVASFLERRRR